MDKIVFEEEEVQHVVTIKMRFSRQYYRLHLKSRLPIYIYICQRTYGTFYILIDNIIVIQFHWGGVDCFCRQIYLLSIDALASCSITI